MSSKTSWDALKDDELLSCMAQAGEKERGLAFDAFYLRHREYFFGICYDLINRYRFAFLNLDHEDLFQSTMLKAFQKAGTFDADGVTDAAELEDRADAWLGGIAKNLIIDRLRTRLKCISFESELLEKDDDNEPVGAPTAVALSLLEDTEINRLVREAIDDLPPQQQAVIWATIQYYERREHQRTPSDALDEIVESLKMSRVSFRKNKERAKNAIREHLNKHQKANSPKQ